MLKISSNGMGEDILSMNTSDHGSTFFLSAVPRKLNICPHRPCNGMNFSPCFGVENSLLKFVLAF